MRLTKDETTRDEATNLSLPPARFHLPVDSGCNGHRICAVTVYELIKAKRDGRELSQNEIEFLVSGYVQGWIPDYEFAALLMAIWFRGMTIEETAGLTQAMMSSGKVFDLNDIPGPKIDKHSTGGVGDKVSLILAPLVAACGVKAPMVAGRGLGHTGGTLDKLESIPGLRTDLTLAEFRRNLKEVGFAIMGQTSDFAPADRKMYALRDVTATVDSIPLIAASIMSKKLAEGIDGLVLDVKTGNGAFMNRPADARKLARTMIEVGKGIGKGKEADRRPGTGDRRNPPVSRLPSPVVRVVALLTDMSQPLGRAVGNSLEVIEAIEALKGRGEPDVMEVTMALGVEMLRLCPSSSRPSSFVDQGLRTEVDRKPRTGDRRSPPVPRLPSPVVLLRQRLLDGSALQRFRQMVKAQGGDDRVVDDYKLLPTAKHSIKVPAQAAGFVQGMDTFRIGMLAVQLGAGRQRKEDSIDPAVGFWFRKKVGESVRQGDTLAEVRANDIRQGRVVAKELRECFRIGEVQSSRPSSLVLRRIRIKDQMTKDDS
jgi:pyrimidine-nucleoside phosphorylase